MRRLTTEYVVALIRHSAHFVKTSVLFVYNKILMEIPEKVVPAQGHEGVWGDECIALHIFNLGTIWR